MSYLDIFFKGICTLNNTNIIDLNNLITQVNFTLITNPFHQLIQIKHKHALDSNNEKSKRHTNYLVHI